MPRLKANRHLITAMLVGFMFIHCTSLSDPSYCTMPAPAIVQQGAASQNGSIDTFTHTPDRLQTLSSFKAVTFNLYNRPRRRAERFRLAGDLLGAFDADFIALQEVPPGIEPFDSAAQCYAQRLGMHVFHHWLERGWFFDNGLSILSRYPLSRETGRNFSDNLFLNYKGFVSAVASTPWGSVGLINVHLASVEGKDTKRKQFQELEQAVMSLALDMPVIVMGDFNEEYQKPDFDRFIKVTSAQHAYTGGATDLELRSWSGGYGQACDSTDAQLLDYILIVPQRTPQAVSTALSLEHYGVHRLEPVYASDHCPVVATVRISHGESVGESVKEPR